jgi:hypothetical protein
LENSNILFYAQGGGLGHLQRAIACIKLLQLPINKITIVSSSPYLPDFAKQFSLNFLPIPLEFQNHLLAYRQWLATQLKLLQIGEVYLDVFPCGIAGEWNLQEQIQEHIANQSLIFHYIGRRLQWKNYAKWVKKPIFFESSYIFEPLEEEHDAFLQKQSKKTTYYQAKDLMIALLPQDHEKQQQNVILQNNLLQNSPKDEYTILGEKNLQNFWLVLHSEPLEELLILLNFALQMHKEYQATAAILVVSQSREQDFWEAWAKIEKDTTAPNVPILFAQSFDSIFLFSLAEKIFSACGFNTMYQTDAFAEKHHFLPFARTYDDQFWRAEQRKKAPPN